MNKKIIVVLGPTASGKTKLAIRLAKKFNGEVISADSRQVYKKIDIGTDKIPNQNVNGKNGYFYNGIEHHLIDVVSPTQRFTVAQYRKLALRAIDKIFKKEKIPILCGGTGFYIQAVIDGIIIPQVKPDWNLRKELEKKTKEELFKQLKKICPKRAKTIDRKNKRRLIRALEIAQKLGGIPPFSKDPLPYPVLMIGIKKEKEELRRQIKKRFLKWLKQGLLKEVENLKKTGLSWKRIEDFGIHYRVIAKYLQKKIGYQEMIKESIKEIENYAKRQMTWFKKDKRIQWVKNHSEAEKLVRKFLRT